MIRGVHTMFYIADLEARGVEFEGGTVEIYEPGYEKGSAQR